MQRQARHQRDTQAQLGHAQHHIHLTAIQHNLRREARHPARLQRLVAHAVAARVQQKRLIGQLGHRHAAAPGQRVAWRDDNHQFFSK